MAAHSTKILPSLQEDTLQAQAVIPSFTSNGKFYYSLRDIFFFSQVWKTGTENYFVNYCSTLSPDF